LRAFGDPVDPLLLAAQNSGRGPLQSYLQTWLAQHSISDEPGLTIAPVTTNVLFDLILSWLFRALAPRLRNASQSRWWF
jgi:hypothetical protein